MHSRRQLLLAAGAVALSGCASAAGPAPAPVAPAPAPPPPPGASQQLARLMDEIFAETLSHSPELATSLGLDKGANADAKSRLHDASLAGLDAARARVADQLRRMRGIDRAALSGKDAINYDSIVFDLEATDASAKRFPYGGVGAGSPYVISQITGAYQDVPDFLSSQHSIETREDAQAYVVRLDAFARTMDDERERVRRDAALGVIPPDFAVRGAITQLKALRVDPSQSTLVTSLADRARANGLAGDWGAEAGRVFSDRVVPALDRQIALLTELSAKAPREPGCWRLPDGEAYYERSLLEWTTTPITAAEVHAMGLEVTAELSARADVLFRKLGYTKGTVGERFQALYKSGTGVYPNTDAGKAKLIADLNKIVQGMQARLPEVFGTLPKAPVVIQRIPAATEQGASTHYSEPSLDGSRPGIYWLNLRDTAESPFWFLPTTTYHEAIPGHHLQITLQREADLPMLRRVAGFGAYSEGWALYSEQLAQEMGMYEGQPLYELGYIHDALLRSARLVTDSGLHSLRWSREKAIQVMRSIEGDPEPLAAQEIERYSVWPGQACSYMVGKRHILALREQAKSALGPRFDLKAFHDAVLLSGAMPLTVLDSVVAAHINSRKA